MFLFVVDSFNLGGTEKNMILLAKEVSKKYSVIVSSLISSGPLIELLELNKLEYFVSILNIDLCDLFYKNKIKYIYIARSGEHNDVYTKLFMEAKKCNCEIFEHNIFANYDNSYLNDYIDVHMFLSSSQILKYKSSVMKCSPRTLNEINVGILPNIICNADITITKEFSRNYLGIPQDAFVVGFVGRGAIDKFDYINIAVWMKLSKKIKNLFPVVRTLPKEYKEEFLTYFGENCKVLPLTLDALELNATYASMDIFFNLSIIGESFGIGMIDAMSYGVPSIVDAKEDYYIKDNTQVEHILISGAGYIGSDVNSIVESVIGYYDATDKEKENISIKAKEYAKKFSPYNVSGMFLNIILTNKITLKSINTKKVKYDILSNLSWSKKLIFITRVVKIFVISTIRSIDFFCKKS